MLVAYAAAFASSYWRNREADLRRVDGVDTNMGSGDGALYVALSEIEDTVTVKKNLILRTGSGSELNMLEEMASMRRENEELRESFEQMRQAMESMMSTR